MLPAKTLVGRPIIIDSTLGSEIETYELVKDHWIKFFNELHHTPRDKAYGLIFGSDQTMNDERLNYVASVEAVISEGVNLDRYELSEQLYAIFEIEAQKQSCHFIADYIYGIWLPQSDYQRSEGYDFELLNCEKPGARPLSHSHQKKACAMNTDYQELSEQSVL